MNDINDKENYQSNVQLSEINENDNELKEWINYFPDEYLIESISNGIDSTKTYNNICKLVGNEHIVVNTNRFFKMFFEEGEQTYLSNYIKCNIVKDGKTFQDNNLCYTRYQYYSHDSNNDNEMSKKSSGTCDSSIKKLQKNNKIKPAKIKDALKFIDNSNINDDKRGLNTTKNKRISSPDDNSNANSFNKGIKNSKSSKKYFIPKPTDKKKSKPNLREINNDFDCVLNKSLNNPDIINNYNNLSYKETSNKKARNSSVKTISGLNNIKFTHKKPNEPKSKSYIASEKKSQPKKISVDIYDINNERPDFSNKNSKIRNSKTNTIENDMNIKNIKFGSPKETNVKSQVCFNSGRTTITKTKPNETDSKTAAKNQTKKKQIINSNRKNIFVDMSLFKDQSYTSLYQWKVLYYNKDPYKYNYKDKDYDYTAVILPSNERPEVFERKLRDKKTGNIKGIPKVKLFDKYGLLTNTEEFLKNINSKQRKTYDNKRLRKSGTQNFYGFMDKSKYNKINQKNNNVNNRDFNAFCLRTKIIDDDCDDKSRGKVSYIRDKRNKSCDMPCQMLMEKYNEKYENNNNNNNNIDQNINIKDKILEEDEEQNEEQFNKPERVSINLNNNIIKEEEVASLINTDNNVLRSSTISNKIVETSSRPNSVRYSRRLLSDKDFITDMN